MKLMNKMLPLFALLAVATTAQAEDLPKLLKAGEYTCQISKEYKFRKCTVVDEGQYQVLSLRGEKHLLELEGVMYPSDFVGKTKQVFVEASITEDQPYICGVKDPAANAECKAQKVIITMQKKGKMWVGSFPLKHYWNAYEGEGEARHISGHTVTIEPLSFKLKL